MGRKTSVYLSDDLDAQVRASKLPLAELIRRGLARSDAEPVTLADLRAELAGLPITTCHAQPGYNGSSYEPEHYLQDP